ncbi:peptidoglycan DD-metalloendopeptidase family protein [Aeromicrobium sp. CF4.19]|uniref:peptidoglycan DD-metalloendopeptidase family protein n=1 Tax=Aeromicrobium sp. CF4.19 TaxID=3373082 RepID=UPI003EE4A24D
MKRLSGGIAALVAVPALLLGLIVFVGGEDQADAATGYGDELNPAGIPAEVVPWIRKAAETCEDITAPLLAAQMKAESNFNPRATSPVGAQGIAQFMPGTWDQWGQDDDNSGTASPFDIGDAVMAQGRFMCALIDEVGDLPGDKIDLALAAYNAGPGAVRQYRGVPPYAETRGYIKKISAEIPKFTAAIAEGKVALPIDPSSAYVSQNNWGKGGSRWSRGHTGNDFSVACGTPVRAANNGTIIIETDQGWSGRWLVRVQAAPGKTTTWYAHMQAVSVKDGQKVKAGQSIGQVGNEGNSSGCHLHFEYHPKGGEIYEDNTDPIPWLRDNGVKIR